MKVLHTVSSLVPETGGLARYSRELAIALARRAVQLQVLTIDMGERFTLPLTAPSPLVQTTFARSRLSVGLRHIWVPDFRSALTRLIDDGVELIHDHGVWLSTNVVAAKVAADSNVPLLVSPHGMLEPWSLNYRGHRKRVAWILYQKRHLRMAAVLHATSEAEAMNLRKLGLDQPIAVIPIGVPLPEYRKRESGSQKTLLFLSRIHPKKGLLQLVKAISQISPRGWRVIVAGPADKTYRLQVEKVIDEEGLRDSFTFIGPVRDESKWEVYQRADLFVLPSFSENFGIVVVEAMACGLPVITTKGTPWKELETHNCGWWVEASVDSLVQALDQAMSLTGEQRAQMGKNGRRLAESKYSWTSVATKMANVYEWMLGRSGKPDYLV